MYVCSYHYGANVVAIIIRSKGLFVFFKKRQMIVFNHLHVQALVYTPQAIQPQND